ncbi:MAG: response regulator transcription factor [Firmicutes bacterium]|nr:response regulator transcription factor [Bacillota bacterium]
MFRIALCDDERDQLSATEKLLKDYSSIHPESNIHIQTFSSGAALLEHMNSASVFDVYFLDIILAGENGIDLGMKIREIDKAGSIVYLSTSPDFALDSYKTKASKYLLKPVASDQVFSTLDEILEVWLQEHQTYITVKTRNGLHRIAIRNIVFGELSGHSVKYHLSDGSVLESTSIRTSFKAAISTLLKHDRFALCATSFFVNLSFVEMVEPAGLKLINGGSLPLSRTLRASVH